MGIREGVGASTRGGIGHNDGSQTSVLNCETDTMVVVTSLRACLKSRSPVMSQFAWVARPNATCCWVLW